ncbi:hypothetical protein PGTUg99_007178 [Puccinia graminis f. sp. tritici]|uniref:Uncharacterized protein n=1 Tax=Puccinia graminis f. sp. tritici TaxID=56615 RepID=A0A5B0N765_PUCGR|nr:hypothetical protein PGTUg99_007178 [Puccinia graminis f. sp. tritici]
MRELDLNAWKTVAVHGQIQDEEAQKSEAQKKKKFGIPGARDRKLSGNCCIPIQQLRICYQGLDWGPATWQLPGGGRACTDVMVAFSSKKCEDSDGPTPDFATRKMRELDLYAWKTVAVHGQIQDKEVQKNKKFGIPGARDRKLYGNCCTKYRIRIAAQPRKYHKFFL